MIAEKMLAFCKNAAPLAIRTGQAFKAEIPEKAIMNKKSVHWLKAFTGTA